MNVILPYQVDENLDGTERIVCVGFDGSPRNNSRLPVDTFVILV